MATLKVKLRCSTVAGRCGTIYYQLTHSRKIRQISTDIHILPDQWDAVGGCLHRNLRSGKWAVMQGRIDNDAAIIRHIIEELDSRNVSYTVDDIVVKFEASERRMTVVTYIQRQIDHLRNSNRYGTACNYERTMRSFRNFTGDAYVPVTAITEQLIEDYHTFLLRRGLVRNSISFYMRILRAVYNKAVRQQLVVQTYPFRNVYTGIDNTRKRAVDENTVACLYRLDLRDRPRMALARDLFLFSYFTRGMAFVDIAYLRNTDITDGMIRYTRRKTGQQLSVRIEPCMRNIIERYRSDDSPYVFPLIKSDDAGSAYSQYRTAINSHNHMLRKLSKMLPECCSLTSYTSRHSWATAARNHNIPISVISAGLGHTTERTTQIYLTALENSVIDAANNGIISAIGI